MADNTVLDGPGSGGDTIVTAEISFSGDTAKVQGEFGGILSGAAESYVYTLIVGGAGAVTDGVQRVTLASNDPAVTQLKAGATALGKAQDAAYASGDVGIAPMAVNGSAATMCTPVGVAGDYSPLKLVNAGLVVAGAFPEDTIHNSGDPGFHVLAVRNDTLAALAGTDGDYAPLQVDASGALYTLDSNSAAIKTAVELIDNAISGAGFNITQLAGAAVPIGAGVEATAVRVTLATDSTGLVSVDDNNGSLTVDNAALAVVGEGEITDATQRVTIATNDDGVVHLATIAGDTTSLDGKVTACNTGAVVVSSGTITTVSSVTAIANALPAGDNNIGNVDLVSLPAGNLGQQAKAASLSVAPATDITDATYIGDIKFGEALPAGTNLIGGVISLPATTARYDGTTACTVYEFMVVGTTAGNNTLVTPTEGKKVRLLHLEMIALSATANTVYVVNGDYDLIATAANPIPIAIDADGDNHGGFITGSEWRRTTDTVTEAVVAVQSATAAILYMGTYIEVD